MSQDDPMNGKRILITGITSGIGEELVKRCVDTGMQVTGVVRTLEQKQKFDAQPTNGLEVLCADLSSSEQVEQLSDQLAGKNFQYVVFNAGYARVGSFAELPVDSIDDMLSVNLRSNMRLTHALLPQALSNQTKLVYVSSMVANMPGGNYASYAVSKAGLSHFCRCLRREYPELPVLCIEIGAVDTPMHEKSGNKVTNKKMFKSRDVIVDRLFKAMQSRTGVATLSWDWTIIRRIIRGIG